MNYPFFKKKLINENEMDMNVFLKNSMKLATTKKIFSMYSMFLNVVVLLKISYGNI